MSYLVEIQTNLEPFDLARFLDQVEMLVHSDFRTEGMVLIA